MKREEALKIAKPILFNTEMVKAIQDGRKTETRRIAKPQPPKDAKGTYEQMDNGNFQLKVAPYDTIYDYEIKPKYQVGDILYVRETWSPVSVNPKRYLYKTHCTEADNLPVKWHPSIHMPKEAARIFLRVTSVHAERLQDIITGNYKTPLNINREGLLSPCGRCTHHNGDCKDFIAQSACRLVDEYVNLWNGTVKESDLDKFGWAANPWVWVIEFERVEVTE